MKKRILLLCAIIGTIILASMFTGCDENKGMSIDDRINSFVSDLNGDNWNQAVKDHFHPDSSQANSDKDTLEQYFNGNSFSIDGSISGSGSTKTVKIKRDGGNPTYTFTMKEDEPDDWYIWTVN